MKQVEIGVKVTADRSEVLKQLAAEIAALGAVSSSQSQHVDNLTTAFQKQATALGVLSSAYAKHNAEASKVTEVKQQVAKVTTEAADSEVVAANKVAGALKTKVKAVEDAAAKESDASKRVAKDIRESIAERETLNKKIASQDAVHKEQAIKNILAEIAAVESLRQAHAKIDGSEAVSNAKSAVTRREEAMKNILAEISAVEGLNQAHAKLNKTEAEKSEKSAGNDLESRRKEAIATILGEIQATENLKQSKAKAAAQEKIDLEKNAKSRKDIAIKTILDEIKETEALRQAREKADKGSTRTPQQEASDARRVAAEKRRAANEERRKAHEQELEDERKHQSLISRARLALRPLLGATGQNLGAVGQSLATTVAATGAVDGVGAAAGATGVLATLAATLGPVGIAIAAVTATVGVASAAMFAFTASVASSVRELDNFAQRLGLTDQQARKLEVAAKLTGVEIGALEQGARVLAAALEDPIGQGKRAADSLHTLGIATITAKGGVREMGPVLLELLTKLSHVESQTERVRIANLTLGKGAKAIAPLINDFEALKVVAAEAGDSLDTNATKKLLETNRAITQVGIEYENLKRSLAAKVAPVIIDIIGVFRTIFKGKEGSNEADGGTQEFKTQPLDGRNYTYNDVTQTFVHKPRNGEDPDGGKQLLKGIANNPNNYNYDAATKISTRKVFGLDGKEIPQSQLDYGKKAAKAFRDRQAKTEEGITARLRELREDNPVEDDKHPENLSIKQLEAKLADSTLSDKAQRQRFESILADKKREEAGIKGTLESLKRSKSDRESILRELRALHSQADQAEAVDGVERVEKRKENFLEHLVEQHPSKSQLAQGAAEFDRIEAATKRREADAIARNENAKQLEQLTNILRRDSALRRKKARAKFGDPDENSEQAIEFDYQQDIADTQSEFKLAVHSASSKAYTQKQSQELVDNANERANSAFSQAKYNKEVALFDLKEANRKKDEQAVQANSQAVKDAAKQEYDKDIAKADRLLRLKSAVGGEALADAAALKLQFTYVNEIYKVELADAANKKEKREQETAALKARLDLTSKIADLERDHEVNQAALTRKNLEETHRVGEELFGAIIGGRQGLSGFSKGIGTGIGSRIFGNVFSEVTHGKNPLGNGSLGGLIGGQTEKDANGNTVLTKTGRILAGTPFGVDTQKIALEQEKLEIEKQIAAQKSLTGATKHLDETIGKLVGVVSGEGVAPGAAGVGAALGLPGSDALAKVFGAASSSLGSATSPGDALAAVFAANNASLDSASAPAGGISGLIGKISGSAKGGLLADVFKGATSKNPFGNIFGEASDTAKLGTKLGSGLEIGAVIGAGLEGVLSGIKTGGARGTVKAIGSAATSAAVLDQEPISKAVLTGVALVSGIVGGLFGDPRKNADNRQNELLQREKYIAPQQLNTSTDVFGYNTDYDKFGQFRSTDAQGQTVRQGAFQKYKGQYYDIPGAVFQPGQAGYDYPTPPKQSGAITFNLQVHALDSQSIINRSGDIAGAIVKELNYGGAIGEAVKSQLFR